MFVWPSAKRGMRDKAEHELPSLWKLKALIYCRIWKGARMACVIRRGFPTPPPPSCLRIRSILDLTVEIFYYLPQCNVSNLQCWPVCTVWRQTRTHKNCLWATATEEKDLGLNLKVHRFYKLTYKFGRLCGQDSENCITRSVSLRKISTHFSLSPALMANWFWNLREELWNSLQYVPKISCSKKKKPSKNQWSENLKEHLGSQTLFCEPSQRSQRKEKIIQSSRNMRKEVCWTQNRYNPLFPEASDVDETELMLVKCEGGGYF